MVEKNLAIIAGALRSDPYLAGSKHIVMEDNYVHFKVVAEKLPNYMHRCTGWLTGSDVPSYAQMVDIVRMYTGGADWFCSKVNIALACDYQPGIQTHHMYIRQLKYCCGKMKGWKGPLFRGIDLSDLELDEMKKLKRFYLPSFTSASKDKNKAFSKTHVLVLECSDASWTIEMTEELSKYHAAEQEVLISCYTLFEFISHDGKFVHLRALRQV